MTCAWAAGWIASTGSSKRGDAPKCRFPFWGGPHGQKPAPVENRPNRHGEIRASPRSCPQNARGIGHECRVSGGQAGNDQAVPVFPEHVPFGRAGAAERGASQAGWICDAVRTFHLRGLQMFVGAKKRFLRARFDAKSHPCPPALSGGLGGGMGRPSREQPERPEGESRPRFFGRSTAKNPFVSETGRAAMGAAVISNL